MLKGLKNQLPVGVTALATAAVLGGVVGVAYNVGGDDSDDVVTVKQVADESTPTTEPSTVTVTAEPEPVVPVESSAPAPAPESSTATVEPVNPKPAPAPAPSGGRMPPPPEAGNAPNGAFGPGQESAVEQGPPSTP